MKNFLILLFFSCNLAFSQSHSLKGEYSIEIIYSPSLPYAVGSQTYILMNPGDSVVLKAVYFNGFNYIYPSVNWSLNDVELNQVQVNQITISDTGFVDFEFAGYRMTNLNLAYNSPTSIEDVHELSTRIYPNPANDYFFVETSKQFKKCEMKILSADGKIVYEQLINSGNIKASIPFLSTGVYFVVLNFDDEKSQVAILVVE